MHKIVDRHVSSPWCELEPNKLLNQRKHTLHGSVIDVTPSSSIATLEYCRQSTTVITCTPKKG